MNFVHQVHFITCDQRCDDHTLPKNTFASMAHARGGVYIYIYTYVRIYIRTYVRIYLCIRICIYRSNKMNRKARVWKYLLGRASEEVKKAPTDSRIIQKFEIAVIAT